MGAHPAHRRLAVENLRGPRSNLAEAVIDAGQGEPMLSQAGGKEGDLIASLPSAAMDINHDGGRGGQARGDIEVELLRDMAGRGVNDVALNVYGLGCLVGSEGGRQKAKKRKNKKPACDDEEESHGSRKCLFRR
jgi:hypothetical protein